MTTTRSTRTTTKRPAKKLPPPADPAKKDRLLFVGMRVTPIVLRHDGTATAEPFPWAETQLTAEQWARYDTGGVFLAELADVESNLEGAP